MLEEQSVLQMKMSDCGTGLLNITTIYRLNYKSVYWHDIHLRPLKLLAPFCEEKTENIIPIIPKFLLLYYTKRHACYIHIVFQDLRHACYIVFQDSVTQYTGGH